MTDLPRKREAALYTKKIAELRALSDEELIEQHDALIDTGGYTASLDYYTDELSRRQGDRRERTMLRLTWAIFFLTIVNVVAVVIDVACS